jgi:antitoxin component YwqK of YwqJK toxin-antitoxin module
VHPLIASSYQAYERGEYPANTQFYVNDENIEEELKYKRKTLVNKAISTLENLSLEKRKKVARLLGLPVSDNSKETMVYNLLDTFIKQQEIKTGDHKGGNPVDLFIKFATMDDALVAAKDLVDQAIKHSIYRITKGGRITEGGAEIAKDKADLVDFLMDEKNQDDLFALQEKLKMKKSVLA